MPGAKAAYELEIEEQEREERARKANPIVRDGGQFLVYSPVYRPISNRIFSNSLPISFPPRTGTNDDVAHTTHAIDLLKVPS